MNVTTTTTIIIIIIIVIVIVIIRGDCYCFKLDRNKQGKKTRTLSNKTRQYNIQNFDKNYIISSIGQDKSKL